MTKLVAARSAQWPLVAEFTFNFDDSMVNTAGVLVPFATGNGTHSFDAIPLPTGAVVVAGDVSTETAFSAAVSLAAGDADIPARYLASTAITAVGRVPLVPTGFRVVNQNVRLTMVLPAGPLTTGKATVRVQYTIGGRSNEVSIV